MNRKVASLLRVDHIHLTVGEDKLKECRDFYVDVLGLEEIERLSNSHKPRGVWMQIEGIEVHIGVEEGVDRLNTRSHTAFEVGDLEAMHRLVLDYPNIDVGPIESNDRFSRFNVRDPAGNRIELLRRHGRFES